MDSLNLSEPSFPGLTYWYDGDLAARITEILPGHVFIPFHYGYWDDGNGSHTQFAYSGRTAIGTGAQSEIDVGSLLF